MKFEWTDKVSDFASFAAYNTMIADSIVFRTAAQ